MSAAPTMPVLSAAQIRAQFIDFFVAQRAHTPVPSSPVVPHHDPTLLFANAGMNQFKPLFLGQVEPGSPLAGLARAANTQKCIRAGGKHNDLDDVGKDTYHHTFFEMLGNWSFGDYFKAEAIDWAWELLTQVWGIDPERLHATYFEGDPSEGLQPDHEARELWRRHLPAERIHPGNKKDNFWEMGDTGPCGPCSEIHFDRSPAKDGGHLVNADAQDTVVEIWNLVFIQFNREPPGLLDLPAKHVDTGMGFERIVRVLQGKDSNYDTDVFSPLFAAIQTITGARAYTPGAHEEALKDPINVAYRVCADHVRSLTFAIADGAEPSNEGRGYVLRSILRRAARFGKQTLGMDTPWLSDVVPTLVEHMGETFPELAKAEPHIRAVINDEEQSFGRTIEQGIKLFEQAASESRTPNLESRIPATAAFQLHDTYGFPIDLTRQMAEERGLTVDEDGFQKLMDEARERSRAGGTADELAPLLLPTSAVDTLEKLSVKPTDDAAKFGPKLARATIRAIWNGEDFDQNTRLKDTKTTAGRVALILDKTNCYAEMGGQLADHAILRTDQGDEFHIEQVKGVGGYICHIGRVTKGELSVGEPGELRRDEQRRSAIAANHTATHLLNLALRAHLGGDTDQKGSLVAPDRLRFDFNAPKPLTPEQAVGVEADVRAQIDADHAVDAKPAPLETARTVAGLRAVFGETYPDPVRVVAIGPTVDELLANPADENWRRFSVEFCGGTHLARTGEAKAFALTAEESVSKGIRRLTALTGEPAERAIAEGERLTAAVGALTGADESTLPTLVPHLTAEVDAAEIPLSTKHTLRAHLAEHQKRAKAASKQAAQAGAKHAAEEAKHLGAEATGDVVIGVIHAGADRGALLAAADTIKANAPDRGILLISPDEDAGKLTIVAKVPEPLIARGLKAGDWVRATAAACSGKGGGKPDSAQGGGTDLTKLEEALAAARTHSTETLG
ncbi:MAG: alanine--tRNA ligase [Planctomycetota bacterium]